MILHKKYIDFIIEHDLTQSQFLFMLLLYKKDKKYIVKYKEKFASEDDTMIGKYLTNDLIKRGFIELKGKKQDRYDVTDIFKAIFVVGVTALEEILNIYPPFIENKEGVKIPLVTVDKFVYSLRYNVAINYSYKEHKEVLKDLKYATENDLVRFGVEKFIDSEYWKVFRKLRFDPDTPEKANLLTQLEEDF